MNFHDRLRQGAPLIATFIKTPHHVVAEVLGGTALDALLLDAEHSVFGPADVDRAILGARAMGKPILVRVPDARPSGILQVLDMGGDGVIVPHINTADQARAVMQSALYGDGGRGFATTNRAGAYGKHSMPDHLEQSKQPAVIVQIEDPLAVENIESICDVQGISSVFIGPADLAVAYGLSDTSAPRVAEAVRHVIDVASQKGVPVAGFASDPAGAQALIKKGVTLVTLASEHSAMQAYFSEAALAAVKNGTTG